MIPSTPFYRVTWTLRARSSIALPPLQHAVYYALLCEAARGDGPPQMPEGLYLDAPEQCRFPIDPGELFNLGATFIETDPERASRRLHQVARGLSRCGQQPPRKPVVLGGNFDLVEMRDRITDQALQPDHAVHALSLDTLGRHYQQLAHTSRLTLRFVSPLRIDRPAADVTEGHQFADRDSFRAGQFVRLVQKRLAALGIQQDATNDRPFDDSLVHLVENRLVWVDLEYGSRDRRKTLGGVLGRIVLDVQNPVLRAALIWGQYSRLGKNLHFGFGQYWIEELGPDPGACPRAVPLLQLALAEADVVRAAEITRAEVTPTLQAADNLRQGTHVPRPGQVIEIADADGAIRVLRVPSRIDRALQRVLLSRLGPPLDRVFETSSFAWRRGLGREAAARRIQRLFRAGWRFAVAADFDRFFDSIPRPLLRDRLEAWLGDSACTVAVMAFMECDPNAPGLPTGAPLSPLLANLLLDYFDDAIALAGGQLVRYGDDFLVLTRTREMADRLQVQATQLAETLLLRLNEGVAILDLSEPFTFLGYRFQAEERWTYGGETGPRRVQDLGWQTADRSDRMPALLFPGESAEPVGGAVVVLGPDAQTVDVVGEALHCRRGQVTRPLIVPLAGLEQIVAIGPTGWTPDVLGKLLKHEIPVTFVSTGGWPEGELRTVPPDDPEVLTAQCLAARDPVACLRIARVLVAAKIANFATLLQTLSADDSALTRLREFLPAVQQADSLDSLRGVEGAAAALWYRRLSRHVGHGFSFQRRVAPEASDPVNILLNLAHTQIHRHAVAAARAAGLSPAVGFLHRGDGRYAALAADLQEPFRHFAERSVILATRQLKPTQFIERPSGPHALALNHHASTRFHALLQRCLRLSIVGQGQSESRPWLAQFLATARSLRRHLLHPDTPFEAFAHP